MDTTSNLKIAQNIGLNNGYIFGAISGGYTLVAYLFNLKLFTITWVGTVLFFIGILMMVLSINTARKAMSGFINFREAFVSSFITAFIGTLINTLITILIFNVIDRDAAQTVVDMLSVKMEETLERFSVPQEKIDEALESLDKSFDFLTQLRGFGLGLAFYAAVSAILAAFMKKNPPQA